MLPDRAAFLLARRLGLDALRVEVRGQDPEIDELLMDWHMVALGYREKLARGPDACDVASALPSESQVAARSSRRCQLGTRQVADAAGLKSTAAVTLAARAGRLQGTHEGGRWWFEEDDVAAWIASRKAG